MAEPQDGFVRRTFTIDVALKASAEKRLTIIFIEFMFLLCSIYVKLIIKLCRAKKSAVVYISGIDSLRAVLKRGCDGVAHHMSERHLNRCEVKFSARHDILIMGMRDQMNTQVVGVFTKRFWNPELEA